MSKYIDIVGIVKENKEFTLEIALYDAKRGDELTRSNIIKCESFSNGLLLVDAKKIMLGFSIIRRRVER